VEETTQIELNQVLTDIIADLDETEIVLAEIVVGVSASRASATDTAGVVGEAGSNAVTINLFPDLASQLTAIAGLDLAPTTSPLLSVTLAASKAKAVANTAGAVDTSGSAAQLASIAAADELGIVQEITGQLTEGINGLAVDELSCDGGALADVICLDLGGVSALSAEELAARYPDLGAGAAGVRASAADVAVLPVLSEALGIEGPGVLGVTLSSAEAAAFAVPAQPAAPQPRGPLPRTGDTTSLPMALGLFGAAAVGIAAIRRSRTV
jgi:LPXTG-motif cell wall-anchored protein